MEYLANDGEDLPCADFALLKPLKRSAEYGAIRRRVADPKPYDAWQLDGVHYFIFGLRPDEGAADGPVALFTMREGGYVPLCAVIVTVGPNGDSARVQDLREPVPPYRVHFSADGAGP